MGSNGEVMATFQPSPNTLRLGEEREVIKDDFIQVGPPDLDDEPVDQGDILNVPLVKKSFKGTTKLPPKREGVYYIVSLPVALAFKGERDDFIIPDDLVRDEKGFIVGCRAFARL